jgi:hypothetical protein
MPNKGREIPYFRIAAEGAVVVASILLAFAIDALWTERLERKVEREELSRLYAEFERNRDRILSFGNYQQRSTAASLRLDELMEQAYAGGSEAIALPDTELAELVQAPTYEAEVPVFDGLIRSGRIEIVKNRRIIDALAEWERLIRNASEHELRARRFVDDQLLPALIVRADLRHVLLNQYYRVEIVPLDPDGTTIVRVDAEIMGLVAQRYFHTALAVKMLEQARDAADRVLAAISEFLEM